jgi:hypothetical protein
MITTTVLLPNYKHRRAKVTHYVGRERWPKGRVDESLEYNATAARSLHTLVYEGYVSSPSACICVRVVARVLTVRQSNETVERY